MFKFGGLVNLGVIYALPPRTYRAWVVVFVDFVERRHHDDGGAGAGRRSCSMQCGNHLESVLTHFPYNLLAAGQVVIFCRTKNNGCTKNDSIRLRSGQ